ncbi:MAG TPA: GNAT family N-acetyltransferase [Thermoanaerobaculia bacterium]
MVELKTLSVGDEAALETFLQPHAVSSMFLRANARAAGLVDRGEPLQGTYVAALERGAITALAAHFWNGMLVLQAPELRTLEAVARAAALRSGRELAGLVGPRAQVEAAWRALGLIERKTVLDSRDDLYEIDVDELRVPEDLASGRLTCRRPLPEELDRLARWRAAYSVEALGVSGGADLTASCRREILRLHEEGSLWVLLAAGRPVSSSAFNARLPDVVQIGGVWTLPELRGRGYGRAVVAGSLIDARREGVRRAVLFADQENRSARAAYEALGFRVIGDYGLVIFG